jgi:hypothetical protein
MASRTCLKGVFDQKRVHSNILLIVLCGTSTKTELSEILMAAGAVLVSRFSGLEGGDLVVCDSKPVIGIKDKKRFSIMEVVSVEYVIQCLIHQDLLDSKEHYRFNSW